MAVDTRNKRGSCLGLATPWKVIEPDPDGAIAQADRQQAAYTYPGILADAPVAATGNKLPLLGAG